MWEYQFIIIIIVIIIIKTMSSLKIYVPNIIKFLNYVFFGDDIKHFRSVKSPEDSFNGHWPLTSI
jgi:hypothetical protein